ncbi:MAG: TRAP transporter small permease [Nitrospirae bacterium]|nr:TRAP transporter small permease [Nitrospirota bacterium]
MSKKERIKEIIVRTETILSFLFFTGMFGAILIQVFFRYVLNNPLVWPYELSVYCYIYIIYAGAVMAARRDSHISFDIFYNRLPKRARLLTSILGNLIVIASFISILPASFRFLRLFWEVKSSSMGIPLYMVLLSFPCGMMLIALYIAGWTIKGFGELTKAGKL